MNTFSKCNKTNSSLAAASLLAILVALPGGTANAQDEGCDQRCLEKLLSQVYTLKQELKSVQAASRASVPVGSIQAFAGAADRIPIQQGFVACDGSVVSKERFPKLFDVIGWSYTPESERTGDSFRVPDLRGRMTLGEGVVSLASGPRFLDQGTQIGSGVATLSAANLPGHRHEGTTLSENRGHYHEGRTGADFPDHTHGTTTFEFRRDEGKQGSYWHLLMNPVSTSTAGASNRHYHDFSTRGASNSHEHGFVTNFGIGLESRPFQVLSPSLVVRYMIKAE